MEQWKAMWGFWIRSPWKHLEMSLKDNRSMLDNSWLQLWDGSEVQCLHATSRWYCRCSFQVKPNSHARKKLLKKNSSSHRTVCIDHIYILPFLLVRRSGCGIYIYSIWTPQQHVKGSSRPPKWASWLNRDVSSCLSASYPMPSALLHTGVCVCYAPHITYPLLVLWREAIPVWSPTPLYRAAAGGLCLWNSTRERG